MLSKKKLLIDADAILSRRPSGIGATTIALIRALSEDKGFTSKYSIILITPFNRVNNVKAWGFNKNVSIARSPLTGKIQNILGRLRLMPPVDIVFGKGIYLFSNFRNWPLLRSPSLTYIHDVAFRVYPEYIEKKNLAYLQNNILLWMGRTDVVVTVSEHAKSEIETYFPEVAEKVKVVQNGISDDFSPKSLSESMPVIDKYNLRHKEYFMFLSNIEPRKNIKGLLDAYEAFIKQEGRGDIKLLLVGGMGWNNDDILRRIEEINNKKVLVVKPDQYVPDSELPALLSGAAALVHPAHYEGFGISPLQAMACGAQVVVANNTSLPEVVGDAGVYVDAAQPKDILNGMNKAYNKRNELNTNGIARAKTFTWRSSASKLAIIIEDLGQNNGKK